VPKKGGSVEMQVKEMQRGKKGGEAHQSPLLSPVGVARPVVEKSHTNGGNRGGTTGGENQTGKWGVGHCGTC